MALQSFASDPAYMQSESSPTNQDAVLQGFIAVCQIVKLFDRQSMSQEATELPVSACIAKTFCLPVPMLPSRYVCTYVHVAPSIPNVITVILNWWSPLCKVETKTVDVDV